MGLEIELAWGVELLVMGQDYSYVVVVGDDMERVVQ